MIGQTIYATTKLGNVKTWKCDVYQNVDGSAKLIISTQTKIDGKAVVREEIFTEGKNLGRSNETTPHEQAISEATSRYEKKAKEGYKTEIPSDTSKANFNALDLPKPMLAHTIDKRKDLIFPAFVQAKLNGHRAIVTKRDGKMIMYSRAGTLIPSMDHILRDLDPVVEEGEFLDGELYIHGEALQKIGSLIKRWQPDSLLVEYWVYDKIMDATYSERYRSIIEQLALVKGDSTKRVGTVKVDSLAEAWTYFDKFTKDGCEGAILRLNDKGYEAGFRSRSLLKLKEFQDDEFKLIRIEEAKDHNINGKTFKVPVFVCVTKDGKEFEATAHGDFPEKDKIWHDRKKHIGRIVTVKFAEYTEEGRPFHPISLGFREDI